MSPRRILLVDDEIALTRALRYNLEECGDYEVRVVNAGREAADAAAEFHPDIIFLDLMMPDMDGSDVAAQLALKHSTADIPVVFLTAVVQRDELAAGALTASGHHLLPKPTTIGDVLALVDRLVPLA